MNIKDLARVSITFYSSEVTEYHYYTYNSMSKPIKWKSYNVPYQGIIRESTNFINKMVKKYPFLENFKYIDYFFIMVYLQKALDSKIISESSNIILQVRIPSEKLNKQKSMVKLLEYYEKIGFEQMFPEDYEKVIENLYVNENNYIPMIGNVKMIMYLFRLQTHDFTVAYELLDEPTTRQNSFSVTSSIKKKRIHHDFRRALNKYQNSLNKYEKKEKFALILCQRKMIMREILKRDYTQQKINSELELMIKFFLQTESVDIKYMFDTIQDEESDFNMILDKSHPKAETFVKEHQNFYDLIVLQTCPDEIMDLQYISDILKNEGYIIITKLNSTLDSTYELKISNYRTIIDKYTLFGFKHIHKEELEDEIKNIFQIAIVFQKVQPDEMIS